MKVVCKFFAAPLRNFAHIEGFFREQAGIETIWTQIWTLCDHFYNLFFKHFLEKCRLFDLVPIDNMLLFSTSRAWLCFLFLLIPALRPNPNGKDVQYTERYIFTVNTFYIRIRPLDRYCVRWKGANPMKNSPFRPIAAIWAILVHLYSEIADEPPFHRGPLLMLSLPQMPLRMSSCCHQGWKVIFSHCWRTLVSIEFSERWLFSHLFTNVQGSFSHYTVKKG